MEKDIEKRVTKKVINHLVYFLSISIIIFFLDRTNVSFAALEMNKALGFSPRVFGLGAGIYFIGFFIFQIPNILFLTKLGFKIGLPFFMILWGIIVLITSFTNHVLFFYVVRFLLGGAEAGFVAAIFLYLNYWFPKKHQGYAFAFQSTAIAISIVITAPLSTSLLYLHWLDIPGWRWMFFLEGLLPILYGIFLFYYLAERPSQAKWLTLEEVSWLNQKIESEQTQIEAKHHYSFWESIFNLQILLFSAYFFLIFVGFWGLFFWLPLIVSHIFVITFFQVGLIVAIPFLCGAVVMVLYGQHSDRTLERKWHLSFAALVGSVSLAISSLFLAHPIVSYFFISLSIIAMLCALGIFWTKPAAMLASKVAAGAYGFIIAISGLGGFLGPYLMGYIKEFSPSYNTGLLVLAAFLFLASVIMAFSAE